jgi:RNA recognition motif-containing protein
VLTLQGDSALKKGGSQMSLEGGVDPDNTPQRSRLFMVVPKNANGSEIESRMSEFPGMQYCKTDLIASKGIVFVKYNSSSSAYAAMEAVQASGSISGYRVKVMIAEPKNRRMPTALNGVYHGIGQKMSSHQLPNLDESTFKDSKSLNSQNILQNAFGQTNYGSGFAQGLTSLMSSMTENQTCFGTHSNASSVQNFESCYGNEVSDNTSFRYPNGQIDLNSVPPGKRLFVVVHKGVNEEALSSIFRCFPEMEYLDLKRDRVSGRSKGYAYVNYHSLESAKAAQAQLNGVEFPQGSGCMLKVLFAAPLNVSRSRQTDLASLSVSSTNSELQNSPAKAFLNTPSQDTAATAFQLPSPNSRDSVGQFGYGTEYLQNSARTDLSSASHDSLRSPLSSPLGNSKIQSSCHDDINRMEQSLVDLRLDLGLFEGGDDNQKTGTIVSGLSLRDATVDALRDSVESSFGSFTAENHVVGEKHSDVFSLEESLHAEKMHDLFEEYDADGAFRDLEAKVSKIRISNDDAHTMIKTGTDLSSLKSHVHQSL